MERYQFCKFKPCLSKLDFERYSKSFKVYPDSTDIKMPRLIQKIGYKVNSNPVSLWWRFNDGAEIVYHLLWTETGAVGECAITTSNGKTHKFPCRHSLSRSNYFAYNKKVYICQIEVN